MDMEFESKPGGSSLAQDALARRSTDRSVPGKHTLAERAGLPPIHRKADAVGDAGAKLDAPATQGEMQRSGGIGRADDAHEQHADAVTDRVVNGERAEELLDHHPSLRQRRLYSNLARGADMRTNALLAISMMASLACSSHRAASMPGDDASVDAPSVPSQWYTRDVYSVVGNIEYQYTGIAEGINGTLFAVGTYRDPSRSKHWFLRKSTDNGLNWGNTGWDISEPSTDPWPYIVTDSRGSIYIGGNYQGTWTVFKSTDTQGSDFTIVDSTPTAGQRGLAPRGLIVNANNEIFAIITGTTSPSHLVVRKSDSIGMNWTTILQYSDSSGNPAIAFDASIDSSGGLFVGARVGAFERAVIQYSANNGASWSTIEDFQPTLPQRIQERNVLRVLGTKLYFAGTTQDGATSTGAFFVHECDIMTTCTVGSWSTSDLQPIDKPFGSDAGIFDIGQDSSGTLWLNGYTSVSHNRKKPATGAWSSAESEVGFNHFGTYLRTSSNRFYMAGMILDPPNLTAIIMEYL